MKPLSGFTYRDLDHVCGSAYRSRGLLNGSMFRGSLSVICGKKNEKYLPRSPSGKPIVKDSRARSVELPTCDLLDNWRYDKSSITASLRRKPGRYNK